VDRSEGSNCWAIHGLGTRHQVCPSKTTNIASFCGPISDIRGSSNSRTKTHAAGSSRHVVHRAQTRFPASRDICGQRFARSQPCSPGRDGVILGLGVTERMWRSSFGKGSDQIRERVRGKCRTVLAAAILWAVLCYVTTPLAAPTLPTRVGWKSIFFLLQNLPRKKESPRHNLSALARQLSGKAYQVGIQVKCPGVERHLALTLPRIGQLASASHRTFLSSS
jgi:hypothetical protein